MVMRGLCLALKPYIGLIIHVQGVSSIKTSISFKTRRSGRGGTTREGEGLLVWNEACGIVSMEHAHHQHNYPTQPCGTVGNQPGALQLMTFTSAPTYSTNTPTPPPRPAPIPLHFLFVTRSVSLTLACFYT